MKETDINKWATLMIEKIQSIDKDWKKPWFTDGALQWPKNLNPTLPLSIKKAQFFE